MRNHLISLVIVIISSGVIYSQESKDEENLSYTYLGPLISIAYNNVEYSEWSSKNNSTETTKKSNPAFAGGAVIQIYSKPLCGDFQIKYIYTKVDTTLTYLEFSALGKYLYPLGKDFYAGGGLGMYAGSPPANRKYDGSAGFIMALSSVYDFSPQTKIFMDIYCKYGTYGIADESTHISFGVNAGFVFSVGKI